MSSRLLVPVSLVAIYFSFHAQVLIWGQPIWDDLAFWFRSPDMNLSYGHIWAGFAWPLSASAQKFFFHLFGERYWLYHAVNFSLHAFNAGLVYLLALRFKLPGPRWIFVFFLFHPAAVISAAWMIQLKTLMCFFFAACAVLAFDTALRRQKYVWWFFAGFLLVLSLLSKSASLPLIPILTVWIWSRSGSRRWLVASFGILLFGAGVVSLLMSPYTQDAMQSAPLFDLSKIRFALHAAGFYFWQSLIPVNLAPIKGEMPNLIWISTALYTVAMAWVLWRWRWGLVTQIFAAAHLMILPFLGLIPAPFMSMTWVSDQHLYLALPFFGAAWVFLASRISLRGRQLGFVVVGLFYLAQGYQASMAFLNEDRFYSMSLASNPRQVRVAFNYGITLAFQDRTREALAVLDQIYELSKVDETIRNDPHFIEIEILRKKLIEFHEFKAK